MIFHVITSLNPGGAEMALFRLLSSSGHRATVICLSGSGRLVADLDGLGVRVIFLNLNYFNFLFKFLYLCFLIRSQKPNIVQTWMYHSDLFGGLASRLAGCKNLVWGVRATNPPIGNTKTLVVMRCCAWLSYMLPQKIICVAESAKDSHIKFGYSASKMVVIPNGLDFSDFKYDYAARSAIRTELHLEGSIVIGCVGRYHPDKGQDVLVSAANSVLHCHSNAKFVLVGRGCDSSNHVLKQQIADLGLSGQFICLGERSDIIQCLSSFDVFCLPSRTEGFPNCLLEAMSLYVPCVATDVGDVRYLASDYMALAVPGSPDSLACSINEMLSKTAEEREKIGAVSGNKVRESFSIVKTRERFNQVYVNLVGNIF